MCFNAAKSWKLGWYEDKAVIVSPSTSSRSGRLIGISDYDHSATITVLLKLETGTATDFYVNFNRKKAINSGTKAGGDQVLVTAEHTNGVGYDVSSHVATMSSGDTFTIKDFGGSGRPVHIKVRKIKLSVSPAYADVSVEMGCDYDWHCERDTMFACPSVCVSNKCETKAGNTFRRQGSRVKERMCSRSFPTCLTPLSFLQMSRKPFTLLSTKL